MLGVYMNRNDDFRTPEAKIMGMGPSRSGAAIWWAQRMSALALIPLVIWFVLFIFSAVKFRSSDELMAVFSSPFPTIIFALFLGIGLYHGNIGMKEIIEDYVHNHALKYSLIILVNFVSLASAIAGICALLVFHLATFSFS